MLRLTANDSALAASDELTVTVVSGSVITLEVAVAASSDDAEEDALGLVTLNSSDLELVQKVDAADRGPALRVGGGAQGLGRAGGGDPVRGRRGPLRRDHAADPGPGHRQRADLTTATANISSRVRTSASVLWTPPPWTVVGQPGANQQTVDISPVIQELVNRPGWSSGNAIAIVITGSGKRVAMAFNGSPAGAPRLRVSTAARRRATRRRSCRRRA